MKGTPIHYTAEQLAFVKSNRTLPRKKLADKFNKKFGTSLSISNLASLCKRNGWLTGRTGRFDKGNIPHPNARPKGPNKTSFKKGNLPANVKPIGHERIDSKDGYIWIKTDEQDPYTNFDTSYQLKHKVIWKQHNGEIPDGMVVSFIDGDKLNCSIDNLEMISLAENMQRNRMRINDMPEELRPSLKSLAKLETQRFKKQKELRK